LIVVCEKYHAKTFEFANKVGGSARFNPQNTLRSLTKCTDKFQQQRLKNTFKPLKSVARVDQIMNTTFNF